MKSIRKKLFPLTAITATTILTLGACSSDSKTSDIKTETSVDDKTLVAVEFTDTPAPSSSDIGKMSKTFSESSAIFKYADGTTKEFPLAYNELFNVKSEISEVKGVKYPSGQLYNHMMEPLKDPFDNSVVAETPDSNSLLKVGDKLFLVTHYEYDWLLSDGSVAYKAADWYSRMPMSMTLSELSQDKDTGKMSVVSQRPIDFSEVDGLWIPCFGSQTPWNTHLGSEEDYDLIFNPLTSNHKLTTAGLKAMTEVYFDNTRTANPYHYGFIPEVTVNVDGSTNVVKHYAMGHGTWEMAMVLPDSKTVYFGDDGNYGLMAMFIADTAEDLSAGSVYAARWKQTDAAGGGKADLEWFKLGRSSNTEVRALIDGGATFDSIWDAVEPSAENTCPDTYTRVRAGSSTDECIKLKGGQEKAAAFLETRRYAAYLGATTEWTKMEGIAVNDADKKLYMAISSIRDSMTGDPGEPADDIRLEKNSAGATYTLKLSGGQKTVNGGEAIDSAYVAIDASVEPSLLGKPMDVDEKGNTAEENSVANSDNVFFADKLRTLFIGEDSGMHVNNYVWAYNVDTQKLTRVLSSAAGAENTGLQIAEDMGGHAYIMSNNQHWGDLPGNVPEGLKSQLSGIDSFYAPVGYLGGMPAIK